jgi:hypothetical protein
MRALPLARQRWLREPYPLLLTTSLVLAGGVVLRAVFQPLPDAPLRNAAVLVSGPLILAGVLFAFTAFGRTIRHGRRRERREPIVLPLTMAGSLLGALVLNLTASVGLAQGGTLVPYPIDNAVVHFELWGFASTMVLAIAPQLAEAAAAPARARALDAAQLGALGDRKPWDAASLARPARASPTARVGRGGPARRRSPLRIQLAAVRASGPR